MIRVELTRKGRRRVLRNGLIVGLCGICLGGCFVDNPNATSVSTNDASPVTVPPVSPPVRIDGGPTVCQRMGGFAVAERVTVGLAGELLADCRINAYFNTLSEERVLHLVDCLGKQIGTILGCDGIRYDVDNRGMQCRSMRVVHQNLAIRNGDLDALVEDLVRVLLREGFSQADIDILAPGILSLRGDIVTNSAPGNNRGVCIDDAGVKDASSTIDASGRD
jgi:hypothetical protein